ncbi:hypothetical protein OSG_eHP27_00040 [environmental Halophage eHP-27]|nr:hypothetical protein OSG_eHP27_00040 [environmental Halophage eHP-27]
MPITTTVSWADLQHAYDDELGQLQDAYDELRAYAVENHGENALQRPMPDNPAGLSEERTELWAIQQQAESLDESAKEIQKNQHILGTLKAELGDGDFEIKMLSGSETMDVEAELRGMAQDRGVDVSTIQLRRNGLIVDAATVDAPAGVPRDDDGSPTPSEAPNALTLALWRQVERFNNAGDPDFRAGGLGDESGPGLSGPSATPNGAETLPSPSPDTETDTQPRGEDS